MTREQEIEAAMRAVRGQRWREPPVAMVDDTASREAVMHVSLSVRYWPDTPLGLEWPVYYPLWHAMNTIGMG